MPPPPMTRQTLKLLITEGLGYCCEFAFFKLHKRTSLIADRLGVSDRAVRYHKMAFKQGDLKCEACKKCLKGRAF